MNADLPPLPPDPVLIPIHKPAGLHLVELGHGDDQRFALLFRSTWLAIPRQCRRWMTDWWCGADRVHDRQLSRTAAVVCGVPVTARDLSITFVSPRVELAWGWRNRTDIITPPKRRPTTPVPPRGHVNRDLAVVYGCGHLLRFRAGAVDAMPDAVVRDLVAHELAHVYQDARGYTYDDQLDCEDSADDLASMWGFDVESPDRWAEKVGLAKTITADDERAALEYLLTPGTRTLPPAAPAKKKGGKK